MTEYLKENAYQIINVRRYRVCKAEHFGEKKKKIMKNCLGNKTVSGLQRFRKCCNGSCHFCE